MGATVVLVVLLSGARSTRQVALLIRHTVTSIMPSFETPDEPLANVDDETCRRSRVRCCFVFLPRPLGETKDLLDKLDDATTELMSGEGEPVMLMLGESFMQCEEDYATEYCERQQEVGADLGSIQ